MSFVFLVRCVGPGLLCVWNVHTETCLQCQGHELTGLSHCRRKGGLHLFTYILLDILLRSSLNAFPGDSNHPFANRFIDYWSKSEVCLSFSESVQSVQGHFFSSVNTLKLGIVLSLSQATTDEKAVGLLIGILIRNLIIDSVLVNTVRYFSEAW